MTLVDKTRIAALLTDALAQPREPSEILQRVLRHVDSPQIAVEMTVGERLAPAIAREAPFSEGRFFISVGGGGFMPFGGQEATRFLVRRVNHGRGCDEAVDDLNELLNTSSTDYIAVLALWGVTVDAEITLAENLTLAPFNSLPDSVMKARLMTVDYLDILRPMVFSSQPTCALVYRFSQSPVLLKHGIEQPRLPEPMPAERLMAAALPLSLVGPSAPLQGPHCTQPLELVVGHAILGSGWSMQHLDVAPSMFIAPTALDASEALPIGRCLSWDCLQIDSSSVLTMLMKPDGLSGGSGWQSGHGAPAPRQPSCPIGRGAQDVLLISFRVARSD